MLKFAFGSVGTDKKYRQAISDAQSMHGREKKRNGKARKLELE